MHVCVYIYIYIYTCPLPKRRGRWSGGGGARRARGVPDGKNDYMCVYMNMYRCTYIYIYIERERHAYVCIYCYIICIQMSRMAKTTNSLAGLQQKGDIVYVNM